MGQPGRADAPAAAEHAARRRMRHGAPRGGGAGDHARRARGPPPRPPRARPPAAAGRRRGGPRSPTMNPSVSRGMGMAASGYLIRISCTLRVRGGEEGVARPGGPARPGVGAGASRRAGKRCRRRSPLAAGRRPRWPQGRDGRPSVGPAHPPRPSSTRAGGPAVCRPSRRAPHCPIHPRPLPTGRHPPLHDQHNLAAARGRAAEAGAELRRRRAVPARIGGVRWRRARERARAQP
jgi:hypothetical protein